MPGSMQIRFAERQVGRKVNLAMKRQASIAQKAAGQTARVTAEQIQLLGRADIRAGGNFGTRWTAGFRATPLLSGRDYVIVVTSSVPYFMIFEFGGVIKGKPLLWIPLSFATDAKGVRARDFPGGLFRVDRKNGGAPLLLSIKTGEPKYFGKKSVTEPKKFHIRAIIREVASTMAATYQKARKALQG